MTKVLITGSFDPLTKGHLSLIKRASRLFDEVIIGIFDNVQKNYWWSADERMLMVKKTLQDARTKNCIVKTFQNQLVTKVANSLQVDFLIKGLRNSIDLEYEKVQAIVNLEQGSLETLYLQTEPKYEHISSSLVKELALFNGNYQQYVPDNVALEISLKIEEIKNETKNIQ